MNIHIRPDLEILYNYAGPGTLFYTHYIAAAVWGTHCNTYTPTPPDESICIRFSYYNIITHSTHNNSYNFNAQPQKCAIVVYECV